jgi:hypothetical protein
MGWRSDVEPVHSEHFCCAIRPVLTILPEAADRICEDGVEVPSSSLVFATFFAGGASEDFAAAR